MAPIECVRQSLPLSHAFGVRRSRLGGQRWRKQWPDPPSWSALKWDLELPHQARGNYLAGLQTTKTPPKVRLPNLDISAEALWNSLEEFRAVHAEDTQVLQQLLNKVKLCPNCQKACAHTMHQCNNCCTHLTEDTLAATDNVLMAFVFGIQKGRFPLTISMRACTKEFLVFDDPLCVSVCHLNVIPTKVYIPDLRYLFKDPLRGRKIVHAMLEQVDTVCLEQHWSDEKFRAAYLQAAPGREALRSMGTAGMNFPPSQQQLHLQYVHGPMLPFQYAVFKDGLHLQYKRFFPVQFLLDSLAAGDKVRLDVHENTDIEEIIQMAAVVGVDYDSYWSQMCAQVNTIQESCSPWREADFMYRIVGKNVYDAQTGQELPELNVKAIQAADVKRLQSYSCGATEPGRCCYYLFAKRAAEIESWK